MAAIEETGLAEDLEETEILTEEILKCTTLFAINAERDAIASVGGEIRYTTEPKMATSEIIRYIKENL